MEYLVQFLNNLLDNPESLRLVFVLLAAAGIFVFGLGLMFLVSGLTDPLRRRLQQVVGVKRENSATAERMAKAIEQVSPYVLPRKDWERSKTSARLVQAGYRSPSALNTFYAVHTLLGLFAPMAVLLGAAMYPHFSTTQVIMAALAASVVGLRVPSMVLDRRLKKRQRHIRDGFPDALDLLVVCTEAGLGLNAAIQRVARELTASHPALAEELALVNAEIRAGAERIEALKNLAHRTGLEDIRGLVALLAQSLRFGTSIADTLRVYSEEFRDKRMQRAEEQAAKISTKLIFPMVFCLFPSFFLVAMGPAVLRVVAVFAGLKG